MLERLRQEHTVGAFGLTQKEVDRLREIIRKESGVDLTNEEAWGRAIELLAFAKMLLESLPPQDHVEPNSKTPEP